MLSVVFFAITAIGFGLFIFVTMRRMLKQVLPAPPEAVVMSERPLALRLLLSAVVTAAIVALAVLGIGGASVLGIGFGGGLATVCAGAKVTEFEDRDGRQVLRPTDRGWRGEPYFFAG